ncbi:hypothetical protein N7489_005704 [Penicillium chrysogenum]|uniref:uncharacterized protein n=1 Tax=Penicillium chrysogenum TaxID=5076 RepID=UPI0024DF0D6C|nr:uncharacterized protein N7489_005704 [Penicillium chrysogenum]KAJ5245608.1 hypothetical protein N7489_005704 [Penicillium chrysogenum]
MIHPTISEIYHKAKANRDYGEQPQYPHCRRVGVRPPHSSLSPAGGTGIGPRTNTVRIRPPNRHDPGNYSHSPPTGCGCSEYALGATWPSGNLANGVDWTRS